MPDSMFSKARIDEQCRAVLEQILDAVLLVDTEGGDILFANQAAADTCGRTREELARLRIFDLHHPCGNGTEDDPAARHAEIDESGTLFEAEYHRPDGTRFPVEVHARVGEYGGRRAIFAVVRDISARKEMERKLGEAKAQLEQVFETAADGMRIVGSDFRVLRSNGTLREMSGCSPEDGTVACYEAFPGELCHTDRCPLTRILAGDTRFEAEVDKIRADGTRITCLLTATPYVVDGKVAGIVEDFKDISERRRAENLARHLATHDSLTDLPNRMLFRDRLDVALAQTDRGAKPPALMFVDIDKFKEINDTHGHGAGDIVLTTLARRFEHIVRKADTVARIGGDEITILLSGVESREDAARVARKVLESAREAMVAGGELLSVTVSVGIALHRPGDGADAMLSRADHAMYAVKRRGGGSFEFAEEPEGGAPPISGPSPTG